MAPKTAWAGSSIPSDKIKPKRSQQNTPKPKGKGKEKADELPKSRPVRRLEEMIKKLEAAFEPTRDPAGGCFCQGEHALLNIMFSFSMSGYYLARTHELSSYMPICNRCGLILCTVNPPFHACPHCTSSLLSKSARMSLLSRLNAELADTIAREEDEADRLLEEARRKEGSFPELSKHTTQATTVPESHKVLSLDAKTKKVMVASYVQAPAPEEIAKRKRALMAARAEEGAESEVQRVAYQAREMKTRGIGTRMWADASGKMDLVYVRDALIDREEVRRARKERKSDALGQGRAVPGAG